MSSSFAPASSPDMLKMQEQSLEMITQHQNAQREALASVLTPEQLRVVEDEHNAEQQMQRAQLRIIALSRRQVCSIRRWATTSGWSTASRWATASVRTAGRTRRAGSTLGLNEPARADSNSHRTHLRNRRFSNRRIGY